MVDNTIYGFRENKEREEIMTKEEVQATLTKDINNVLVLGANWEANTAYTDIASEYPFQCFIANSFIKETSRVNIQPSPIFMQMGILSPFNKSINGGVYIFAKSQPEGDLNLAYMEIREVNIL